MTTRPDGCLYIGDMYRGIIQESEWTPRARTWPKIQQFSLDKNTHPRPHLAAGLQRFQPVIARSRACSKNAATLVKHLEHPNGWWRDTAQKLLVLKQDQSIVPTLQDMARNSPTELAVSTRSGRSKVSAPSTRRSCAS